MSLPQIESLEKVLATQEYYPSIHYQIRGNHKTQTIDEYLEWISELPKPTEIQINAWWIQLVEDTNNQLAIENAVKNSINGIKEKLQLSYDYAEDIKIIYNAVLEATLNNQDTNTRFQILHDLVELRPSAFKNRLNNDVLQEVGFDVNVVLPTITQAQKRQYCLYLRIWITNLTLLLVFNKL